MAQLDQNEVAAILPENPHVKFFESRKRGYVLVDVTPETWRTELRVVSTTAKPKATVSTLRSYVVESGRLGAQRATPWGGDKPPLILRKMAHAEPRI